MPLFAFTISYDSKLPRYSRGSIQGQAGLLTGNLLVRELVFEEVGIEVELGDHFVDLLNVSFEALLAILDALVPHH
jgi:hypothetical protein